MRTSDPRAQRDGGDGREKAASVHRRPRRRGGAGAVARAGAASRYTRPPATPGCHDRFPAEFLAFALARDVLRIRRVRHQAGRRTPLLLQRRACSTRREPASLGRFTPADAWLASGGGGRPALRAGVQGITLAAAATAIALAEKGRNLPYSFNRKEAKDHGEGGRHRRRRACGAGADRRRRDHRRNVGARIGRPDSQPRGRCRRRPDRAGPDGARARRQVGGCRSVRDTYGIPVVAIATWTT